jgi:hypothetical protein
MKWATRNNIHIDRAACAWLIQNWIDPSAEFVFISDPADLPRDATPFDMRGVELGAWVSNTPAVVLGSRTISGENLVCQTMRTLRACSR